MKKRKRLDVILLKKPNEPEIATVALQEDKGEYMVGILETEPKQDFGCHKGDTIAFFEVVNDRGAKMLIADMDPAPQLTAEALADGSLLKQAISLFNQERTEPILFEVLSLLRDSNIWIPCTAVMSDADQARFEKMVAACEGDMEKLKDMDFIAQDETRMIPDILQNGENFFFPVFSSIEEMGEYGQDFSKAGDSFLHAMVLARNNERNVSGIVVNAFSDPFILDRDFFDFVENLETRLAE